MLIVLGVIVTLFTACAANYFLVDNNTSAALACFGIAVVAAVGFVIVRTLERIESALLDVRKLVTPHQRTGGRTGRERRTKPPEIKL
jgi:hypothetical protein